MRPDKVAKATEQVFMAGYCEYIEDVPDTSDQTSATAVASIFIELIDNMVRQLKKLEPSPLQEGVKA